MADYKELLRRAVEALPENNGAARRAVYEKARAALVGQLRAINPPLAARDITTHRLQLEDCIRQVEQEASEAVIAGLSGGHDAAPPPPIYFEPPPQPAKQLAGPSRGSAKPQANPEAQAAEPEEKPRESQRTQQAGASIEEIIAAADRDARQQGTPRNGAARAEAKPESKPDARAMSKPIQLKSVPTEPEPDFEDDVPDIVPPKPAARSGGRPLPAIVARAEAAKNRTASTAFGVPVEKPYDAGRRGPTLEARRDPPSPRFESARGPQLALRQAAEPVTYLEPPPEIAAMSAVREVELEPEAPPADPQGLIDRAMATLDREARGETVPLYQNGADTIVEPNDEPADDDIDAPEPEPRNNLVGLFPDAPRRNEAATGRFGRPAKAKRDAKPAREAKPPREPKPAREAKPPRSARSERAAKPGRGRDGGVAEAGFPRARSENDRGGISAVTIFLIVFSVLLVGAGGAGVWAWNEGFLDLDSVFENRPAAVASTQTPVSDVPTPVAASAEPQSGPGNTTLSEPATAAVPELSQDDRLPAEPAAVPSSPALAIAEPAPAEPAQRLSDATAEGAIGAATSEVAALNPEGSQSLLLEASDDGRTGAVPFSGTVEWSQGRDETGLPTLVGSASIPARNLGVDILIRKNVDTTLPASHLMEVNFKVSDSFIGGSVAGLPGVLLKNEELVQGQPLVGASARVVGNSFLFALSSSPEDVTANSQLLTARKWIDLAVIYATGKRAIITLEKDGEAVSLFNEVFATWGNTASAQ